MTMNEISWRGQERRKKKLGDRWYAVMKLKQVLLYLSSDKPTARPIEARRLLVDAMQRVVS